jgi:hypothetical protein
VIFSQRRIVAHKAIDWCIDNGAPVEPFNIVTALDSLGYITDPTPDAPPPAPAEGGRDIRIDGVDDDFDSVTADGGRE